MSDLRELYQEVILDHGKHPRNFRFPEGANHQAEGYNPLCGDRLTLKLTVDGDRIVDVGFQGSGCAISTASASTMTEAIKGKTLAEADAMFKNFHALVTGGAAPTRTRSASSRCSAGSRSFRCASSARPCRGTPCAPRSKTRATRPPPSEDDERTPTPNSNAENAPARACSTRRPSPRTRSRSKAKRPTRPPARSTRRRCARTRSPRCARSTTPRSRSTSTSSA